MLYSYKSVQGTLDSQGVSRYNQAEFGLGKLPRAQVERRHCSSGYSCACAHLDGVHEGMFASIEAGTGEIIRDWICIYCRISLQSGEMTVLIDRELPFSDAVYHYQLACAG
jgi:hypothetical protein